MSWIHTQFIRFFSPHKDHNRDLTVQFFRYLVTGVIGFIFDFGTLYFLTEGAHLYYLMSSIFGFLVGLLVTYLLSILWVFHSRNIKKKHHEFMIFFAITIVALVLNQLFLWFFTEIAVLHYLVSKVFTSILIIFWNFTARKLFLFKNEKTV